MPKSKLGFLVAAIATSSVLGVSSLAANPETGKEVIQEMNRNALNSGSKNVAQVTSVSQLSDVQPTDWAFTALQSLVERYGCIAGYPNGTFRGNRATSRFEFAAGLNACLDKINELISTGLADKVGKEDLATLQKLQEEFAAELTALKGRVTALEEKTATLEAQQFSTTTKLTASVILAAAGSASDNFATAQRENITFSSRVRLNFNTSFSGKDLLLIRLQAGNVQNNSRSALTRLAFDGSPSDNSFFLDKLYYRFPVTDQINIVAGTALNIDDVLDVVNPDLVSAERGAISRFGRYDPLVFRGQEGSGAAVRIRFNEQFAANFAYLANGSTAQNPFSTTTTGGGLFASGYSASAQLVFKPIKPLALSLVYQRGFQNSFDASGGTGTVSNLASLSPIFGGIPGGFTTDKVGLQTNYDFSPNLSLNGRVSFAAARANSFNSINYDLLSWFTTVTLKDLFIPGSQASIGFGQPPYATRVGTPSGGLALNNSVQNPYHLEAFYRFQLNRNISITPGLITIFNPGFITVSGGNPTVDNRPVFVGVLRTSFTF